MTYRLCATFCAFLMLSPSGYGAKPRDPAEVYAIKQRVSVLPAGAAVEVQILHGGKLRGRLATITDTGFELQRVVNDRMTTEAVRYEEVKKIKQLAQSGGSSSKILLGSLAGIGIMFTVLVPIVVIGNGLS